MWNVYFQIVSHVLNTHSHINAHLRLQTREYEGNLDTYRFRWDGTLFRPGPC